MPVGRKILKASSESNLKVVTLELAVVFDDADLEQAVEGYFNQPIIFTNVKPEMKIVKEEICVVIEEATNKPAYGLACNILSQNTSRALIVAHSLEAGSAWVNYAKTVDKAVPFGDHEQSGIGRELGEYALDT
ncbi:Aldehyde dehydrogenase [Termitomyces sp. J132]|nr:Aldehyde dehydrogenase [Termitomyces sp. J132]